MPVFLRPQILNIFVLLSIIALPGLHSAPKDPQKKFREAEAAYAQGNQELAQKLYNEFLNEEPFEYEVREALFRLGEISFRNQDFLGALSYFNRVSERYPSNPHRKEIARYCAISYYRSGAFRRAGEAFRKLLPITESGPERAEIYAYLGEMYEKDRRIPEAVTEYRKSLEILLQEKSKPEAQKALYRKLALLYSYHFKDLPLAYDFLQKSLELQEEASLRFLLRKLTLVSLRSGNGLPDDAISDVKTDGDDVYVGTFSGGLLRYTRSTGKFTRLPVPSPQIRSMFLDDKNIYILTFDGIFVYSKQSGKTKSLLEGVDLPLAQKVVKDDRHLYFTTLAKGVLRYDTINGKTMWLDAASALGTNVVYSAHADLDHVAFGTIEKGAFVLDKSGNLIARFSTENGLKDNNIKAVLLDGRFLWVGVHTAGVYQCDIQTSKCRIMPWDLPYPTALLRRGAEIWVATSGSGIRIFHRGRESVQKLRAIEGLSSNEITLLENEGDYVWIGTLDAGLDVLYRPMKESE